MATSAKTKPQGPWGRDEVPSSERQRGLAKFLGPGSKSEQTTVLTVKQTAERLQVPESTVRHWLKTNQLEGFRLPSSRSGWRIQESALRTFIKAMIKGSASRPGW
jgi:excisionase family DNA binding protein